MEHVDPAYADVLHRLPFNPYSQYCRIDQNSGKLVWRINILTDEAAMHLVKPLLNVNCISLKRYGITLVPASVYYETIELKNVTDIIRNDSQALTKISVVTPTAFKSSSDYVNMPTTRLIFQNLLMHYSQVYEGSHEVDVDTLEYITQRTTITSFNLKSTHFVVSTGGSKKIPAFIGSLTIAAKGPQTLNGLVRMLLRFGEYAGLGIKTSMGMGGLVCLQPNTNSKNLTMATTAAAERD